MCYFPVFNVNTLSCLEVLHLRVHMVKRDLVLYLVVVIGLRWRGSIRVRGGVSVGQRLKFVISGCNF